MTTQPDTPSLIRFRPMSPNANGHWWNLDLVYDLPEQSVIVSPDLDADHISDGLGSPRTHNLYRAIECAGELRRHFNAAAAYEGAAWYDALPVIVAVDTILHVGDRAISVDDPSDDDLLLTLKPDRITVQAHMIQGSQELDPISFDTDVAFLPSSTADRSPHAIRILGAHVELESLDAIATVAASAFFRFDEWSSAPHAQQQREYSSETYPAIARFLLTPEDTTRAIITHELKRHVVPRVPAGMALHARLTHDSVLHVAVLPVVTTS